MKLRYCDPEEIFAGRVLVLVPHMDDEVLACGGTIAGLRDPGQVWVAYATDGSASPAPPAPWIGPRPVGLSGVRTREARAAMEVLGVPAENLHFLDLPDGRLARHREALTSRVRALWETVKPDRVLAPFRFDRHSDHLILNRVATGLVAGAKRPVELIEYFVYYRWRLLPGGDIRRYIRPGGLLAVDISSHGGTKERALRRFESQTTRFFEWQRRPNLTSSLLEEVCTRPEVFLRHSADCPGIEVFERGRRWIRFVHRLEPALKARKDQLVAVWGATFSRERA